MELIGKIALITGAGGGMGSVLVRSLKKEGVKLILVEKNLSLLEHLVDLIDGESVTKYECDLNDRKSVELLAEEIQAKYPKLDFLFNVAGIGIYKKLEELTADDWDLSMNININSVFYLTKNLIAALKKSSRAMVLNFGSGMGKIPTVGRVAYCSSKFALRGFSLTLAEEYKDTNIDFVLMTLGSVMTNFGTGGILARKRLEAAGKNYLKPEEVIEKILNIAKSDHRDSEYTLYPPGYAEEN